ncbi:hypothetical protein [Diaphorobacter aerolatus]|uniref:WG repeat-containing protein n=1 Tax=Diaphorobacter aerolatus TaxID=1288495 RepID=A0A7H0GG81_9BURK|nr:hypothetical protein [Diaphorobacter aerolatus]QNP47297.1 hypothetical protein H9K75_13070 [Diaphorobacter aerolatus]
MTMRKAFLRHLVPAMALFCALPGWAAREFTPQAGLWMIPSENNGQPGRGFSLDVQGHTAFLQVFNYEQSGAGTFHTAVGQLDDAASMTVPLLRFKGGRYLGGPAQDAVSNGTAGNVAVRFTDGLNGTVQFPGEPVQPIARFLVPEKLPYWWTQLSDDPLKGTRRRWGFQGVTMAADGSHRLWEGLLRLDESGALTLTASPMPGELNSTGPAHDSLHCTLDRSTQALDCTAPDFDDGAAPVPSALDIQRVRLRPLGRDIVGVIQPKSAPGARWTLNGWSLGSASCSEPCNDPDQRSIRTYAAPEMAMDGLCITGYCDGYSHIMLLPASGAWMIVDENTGAPGRGVFLDVQDNTIIAQTSDYLANGEPTFHMGSGSLKSSSSSAGATTAEMPIVRYAGGRYFGGPARSGHEATTAGTLKLAFSPIYSHIYSDMATGSVSLPGEEARTIRRLEFEPPGVGMEHLLGEYYVQWNAAEPHLASWVKLTQIVRGDAVNAEGTVRCMQEPQRRDPNSMLCVLLEPPVEANRWRGTARITVNPFHRNTAETYPSFFVRTRDRHGNWLGLGTVSLPGLAIPTN